MINEMVSLVDILVMNNYKSIRRFPLRKYNHSSFYFLLNELDVFIRFFLSRNNIFSISIQPEFYTRINRGGALGRLRDLFFLNKAFPIKVWEGNISKDSLSVWKKKGLLEKVAGQGWRFIYRIVPYDRFFFITSRFDRTLPDFTFLSYDSLYFASFLNRKLKSMSFKGKKALDMCCGVGIQAIASSFFNDRVLGIDVNHKALELAQLNVQLNNVLNCDFKTGNLFENIEGKFDLIVSNPPFIFAEEDYRDAVDSYGGVPYGLGITIEIIKKIPEFLEKNGRSFIITRSPFVRGEDYLLANLMKWLNGELGCSYHYVSDSIAPLSPFEEKYGIQGYRQVILELYNGGTVDFVRYPFLHRKTSLF